MIAGAAVIFHHSKQPASLVEALARFAIVVVLSWLAFKLYDEPVRAVLAKWLDRGRRAEPAAPEPLKTGASLKVRARGPVRPSRARTARRFRTPSPPRAP